jgi:putative membrane protein
MIGGYSDHAANERTFLAWVRTGIAVIAFGFVIERFNLFLVMLVRSSAQEVTNRLRPMGGLGHYEGLGFICGGVAIIVLSTVRFIRTTRLLDDPATHSAKSVRAELVLAAWLVVLVTAYSVYLAFS